MYEIYIDMIFLVNLLPEYIVLSMLSKILKYRTSHIRLAAGCIFSSLMVCIVCMMPAMPYLFKLMIAHLCGRWLVIWLVFRIRKWHMFVRALVLAYGFTFVLGGFMEWICQTPFFVGERRIDMTEFLTLTGVSYLTGLGVYYLWKRIWCREGSVYRVKLTYRGYETEVNGLYDTGNMLTEPISGKPVCILEQAQAIKLHYCERPENYRVIPYYSVGNPGGILHGFTADQMQVWMNDDTMIISNPVIGVCEQKLSRNGKYEMILHPNITI